MKQRKDPKDILGSNLREKITSIRRYIADIDSVTDWSTLRGQVASLKAGLADENVWVNNAAKALKQQTRMARLEKQLSTYQGLVEDSSELSELSELAIAEGDTSMQEELLSELDAVNSRSEKYLVSLWLSGTVDENAAYVEIHAGSGGTEACDWALMLSRMYSRWANDQDRSVQVVDETPGDVAGVKSIVLLISGPYAYGYLQFESGVHRLVRVSPFDQAGARHTSFASVRVSPHFDENEQDSGITINPADLKITTMRSQGAGGQHVNKTESAVRIVHVPSGITVSCQQERSQHRNKTLALSRLRSKLYEIELEKQAQAKLDQHETLPENAWGSQIRSYVLQPYQLVKDVSGSWKLAYESLGGSRFLRPSKDKVIILIVQPWRSHLVGFWLLITLYFVYASTMLQPILHGLSTNTVMARLCHDAAAITRAPDAHSLLTTFMADQTLIVPVVLSSGSLHFANILRDGTVEDVVENLVVDREVVEGILGDLSPYGWALQRVRREHNGRQWEEDELEALGNGLLQPDTPVAPLLNSPSSSPETQSHFSAFPLTSHLHTPTLRLVSLHPFLTLTCTFLRVPEIHDGFQWKMFLSKTSSVRSVIDAIVDELGLTKSLPVPGGGPLEYVLEEVWSDGTAEETTRIPFDAAVADILDTPLKSPTVLSSASRSFRFCVPDEWYRRSRSRSNSSISLEPSEDTVRRLEKLEESDEDSEEGDGTAKQKDKDVPSTSGLSEWRNSLSQNRLSSYFESWIHTTASPTNTAARVEKKVVSEPKLVAQHTGGSVTAAVSGAPVSQEPESDVDSTEFEEMLDSLGLKGPKRDAMYQLPLEQKQYLFRQHRAASMSRGTTVKRQINHAAQASTYSPASASGILPRVAPQLTGDSGILRRFSIVGWASSTSPASSPRASADLDAAQQDAPSEPAPIQPQTTGGLWSSWWNSSGGEKGAASGEKSQSSELSKSPQWYVDGIRRGKTSDIKLVKHLISLRVHLSTADLAWIEDFVMSAKGMDSLGQLLSSLVAKDGKRKKLQNVEETVLLEVIKCIRVLLNTDPGFKYGVSSPTLITHITYSLHGASTKLRALTSDVLAGICYVSPTDGHKAVVSALSDYRVEYGETFRFQELIGSLHIPDETDGAGASDEVGYSNDEEGVWEARTASMAFINALTNFPDSLEERILLREEFSRRGLNEALVALRYVKPPDSLVTQLDIYTEEKFEDEEDLRERSLAAHRRSSPDTLALEELIQSAKQSDDVYQLLTEALQYFRTLLDRDVEVQAKVEALFIVNRFLESFMQIDDLEDGWHPFVKQFTESIQHIVHDADKVIASGGPQSLIEDELDSLRSKIDQLTEERSRLRDEIEQQAVELKTLRSLPPSVGPSPAKPYARNGAESSTNLHGLVQRLVQKEKQVLQLQAELERHKVQNPVEDKEAEEKARRERDRAKWNTVMDEMSKLKTQITDLETSVAVKDKEVVYLKRALESVYSRFRSREESREAEFDAQSIASRAIESLTQKDEEIDRLTVLVEELRKELAAKPKFITEKEYKHQSPAR
ncbi:hypothetical protein NM688_g7443 [Phlebia brevispora]|uniref:Uncharacterized protein n=1 Tax=Phlebia brevispora TaxID=194682 RepID=A0ACC1S5C6_9APHY|nr:hypothetical protein NM688_g7443 [Phlebia brevispora]